MDRCGDSQLVCCLICECRLYEVSLLRGKWVQLFEGGTTEYNGSFEGLAPDGGLLINIGGDPAAQKVFYSAEILSVYEK